LFQWTIGPISSKPQKTDFLLQKETATLSNFNKKHSSQPVRPDPINDSDIVRNQDGKINLKKVVQQKLQDPNTNVKQEFVKQRNQLVQQQMDLMMKIEKAQELASGQTGSSSKHHAHFHISGDDIVEDANFDADPEWRRFVKQEHTIDDALKRVKAAIGSNTHLVEDLETEIASGLANEKRLLEELTEEKKRKQYVMDKVQIEHLRIVEKQKSLYLNVARKKLQEVADACVSEAQKAAATTVNNNEGQNTSLMNTAIADAVAKKAREYLANLDVEFHIAQLEQDLKDTKTKDEENHTYGNIDFTAIDPIWNAQAIKNLRHNKKPIDILLIGDTNVGKTELIKKMCKQMDIPLPKVYLDPKTGLELQRELFEGTTSTEQAENRQHNRVPDIVRVDIPFGGGFCLRILDVSNNLSDSAIYRKLYHQCHWVFITYTVTRASTVRRALSLLREAKEFNNNCLMFGNLLYEAETVKANLVSNINRGNQESMIRENAS